MQILVEEKEQTVQALTAQIEVIQITTQDQLLKKMLSLMK